MAQPSRPLGDQGSDDEAIRAVEAAYDAAWWAGDVDALLTCLTEDAVLVNPLGEMSRGHAAIKRELAKVLNGPARGSKHTSVISRVDFITPDVAIVDGEAMVEMEGDAEAAKPSLTHRFTDVLVRTDDDWSIAHVRAYMLMQ